MYLTTLILFFLFLLLAFIYEELFRNLKNEDLIGFSFDSYFLHYKSYGSNGNNLAYNLTHLIPLCRHIKVKTP